MLVRIYQHVKHKFNKQFVPQFHFQACDNYVQMTFVVLFTILLKSYHSLQPTFKIKMTACTRPETRSHTSWSGLILQSKRTEGP